MLNKYPLWKNMLLIAIVILAVIYAAPNLYGEDPAVQISATNSAAIDEALQHQTEQVLNTAQINYQSMQLDAPHALLIRFKDTDAQLHAKDVLKAALGEQYTTALNLAPATPHGLSLLGANPMKQGLDLRGGIYFSLDIDIDNVLNQRSLGMVHNISNELREANIHYLDIVKHPDSSIGLSFKDEITLNDAKALIHRHYSELLLIPKVKSGYYQLIAKVSPDALTALRQTIVEQTITTLRNRINELGIAEPVVQQQGSNRVTVELPGIQDSARAKQILGGTATLEFRMADTEHDPRLALTGLPPAGTTLYQYENRPVLLKNQVILTGDSITDAQASYGEDGRAAVDIRLGGGGEGLFHRTTAENIGKPMAIVFVESKLDKQLINGQWVKIHRKAERVISVATIRSALPNNFQITGLQDPQEARNLSLLLRAGALPAAIDIVEERTLGPKLGLENIKKGTLSVAIGLSIVIIFMACYYRLFGLIADIGLVINMVLLVALLSLLGMTLTLPGIAGIVLTVGMAVDANVLIFERIREELRQGLSVQASIHAGYERAFATILDANVTTLIVALVLFGLGTGPIKGFAVTLSLGLITSMISGIAITRALVNAIYGGRSVKKLAIGI